MRRKLVSILLCALLVVAFAACTRTEGADSAARANAGPSVLAPLSVVAAGAAESNADTPSAVLIYSQPPLAAGGLLHSAWRAPNGSMRDRWVWENFGFENPQTVSEVRWTGAYDPSFGGSGGPVRNFQIDIYGSIPVGSEPDLASAPLAHFEVGGNADETPAEVLGGVQTYTYSHVLPTPIEFAAATTYWVQIAAFQDGDPDWGLSTGTGTLGDGRHFRGGGNAMEGYYNQLVLGDASIEFLAPVVGDQLPVPEYAASLEDIEAMMADLPPAEIVPTNAEGVQEIMLVVSRSGYTPVHFAVKGGVPVRLTFRQLGYVPGGNELNVRWGPEQVTYIQLLSLTDTRQIEFTPLVPGEYKFSCPHDWYWGVMTVTE